MRADALHLDAQDLYLLTKTSQNSPVILSPKYIAGEVADD